MDGATVLSCAYTFSCSPSADHRFVAIDRLQETVKSGPIRIHIGAIERSYLPSREALKLLPRAVVLYAAPARITTLLESPSRLRTVVLEAKHGMNTFNNFRFLRLRWEVPAAFIGKNLEWEPLSKGGPFALFYATFRYSCGGMEMATTLLKKTRELMVRLLKQDRHRHTIGSPEPHILDVPARTSGYGFYQQAALSERRGQQFWRQEKFQGNSSSGFSTLAS